MNFQEYFHAELIMPEAGNQICGSLVKLVRFFFLFMCEAGNVHEGWVATPPTHTTAYTPIKVACPETLEVPVAKQRQE